MAKESVRAASRMFMTRWSGLGLNVAAQFIATGLEIVINLSARGAASGSGARAVLLAARQGEAGRGISHGGWQGEVLRAGTARARFPPPAGPAAARAQGKFALCNGARGEMLGVQ